MEVWKDIVGYEGYYQVSNFGRVKALERIDSNNRRHFERILSQSIRPNGYCCVHLSKGNKVKWLSIHRLVAMAFVARIDGCNIVNHLDNDRKNNHADNLEWTTYKGNMQWAAMQGRMKCNPDNLKKAQESRKIAVIATDKNGRDYFFRSQVEAAKALNLPNHARGHIAAACRKDRGYKTVGGYTWRYADEGSVY